LESIGERLRRRRKELGLTIKAIRKETGLSIGNISDLENDKYAPSVSAIIPLSKILRVSIDWLLTGSEFQISEEIRPADEPLPDQERDMLWKYRQLDSRDQEDARENIDMKYNRMVKKGKGLSSSGSGGGENEEAATKEYA